MPSLIPKKYSDNVAISAPEVDENCKMKNIIFIGALANGDTNALNTLFSEKTITALNSLGPSFGLDVNFRNQHFRNFPERYQMDETMRGWAIAAVLTPVYPNIASWPESKKWAVIKILVENGADAFPILSSGRTSLARLKQVISWGADPSSNHLGFSALHAAVISAESPDEKVAYLIEQGANVNSISQVPGYEVGTPWHLLLANEDIDRFCKYIDLTAEQQNSRTAEQQIIDPNLKDGEGKTLTLLAAKIRSPRAVRKLQTSFSGTLDVNEPDVKNRSPLHFSSVYGDKETSDILLSEGANPDAQDNRGNRPLHYACAKPESAKAILSSIEIDDRRDSAADLNAIKDKNKQLLLINEQEILTTKSNMEVNFNQFYRMVNKATNPNRVADIQYLGNLRRTLTGKSLAEVCMEGRKAVVECLLNRKANPLATNLNGKKPSDIAQIPDIKRLLLDAEQQLLQQKGTTPTLWSPFWSAANQETREEQPSSSSADSRYTGPSI